MKKTIHFHHVFDLDFDQEKQRLENAWSGKPLFKQAILAVVAAIEEGDLEKFHVAWTRVKKENPHPENKPIEYLDASVVAYWSLLGVDNKNRVEGPDALHAFNEFRQDASFSSALVQVHSVLEVNNEPS